MLKPFVSINNLGIGLFLNITLNCSEIYSIPFELTPSTIKSAFEFIISLNLSMSFFAASVKALIHSFIPSLFITSSTDCIRETSHFINICYDEFTD